MFTARVHVILVSSAILHAIQPTDSKGTAQ